MSDVATTTWEDLTLHNQALLASEGFHHIRRRLHTCDTCGKVEEWRKGWRTYGSIADEENGELLKFCSDGCVPADKSKKAMKTLMIAKFGPKRQSFPYRSKKGKRS